MPKTPPKPPGRCIFCGLGNLSKEHIWPEWANPLIAKHPAKQRVEHSYTIDPDKVPRKLIVRTQPGDVTTKKLRVVCASCNNTWMSALEEKAKPCLMPLIQGRNETLDIDKQKSVASWVALKCMVMEQTEQNARISSQERLFEFKRSQNPPDGMHIWTGECGQAHWASAYFRTSATVTESPLKIPPVEPDGSRRKNAHYVSFGIGCAFFFVFYTTNRFIKPDFGFNSVLLRRLWPFEHNIGWPPLARLTMDQCNSIRDAYSGMIDNPPGVAFIDK